MSRYVSVTLPAGTSAAVGQLVPVFTCPKADTCTGLLADGVVTSVKAGRASIQVMKVEPLGGKVSGDESGVAFEDWLAKPYGLKFLRFVIGTGTAEAVVADLDLTPAELKKHLFAAPPGDSTADQGKSLVGKKVSWTLDVRRDLYWPLVERAYPHLKGLNTQSTRPNGLCAEASLLLSVLMLSEQMKFGYNKAARSSAVADLQAEIAKFKPVSAEDFQTPCSALSDKLGGDKGRETYPGYILSAQKSVTALARDIYKTFFKGPEPLPQVRMTATGDGSGTFGILGKFNEGFSLVTYDPKRLKSCSTTFNHAGDGNPTVLHFFVAGMNYKTTRLRITLVAGTRKYQLLAIKDGNTAKLLTSDTNWKEDEPVTTAVEATAADGTKRTVRKWADGAYYDPVNRDFVFPTSAFASVATFDVHVLNTDTAIKPEDEDKPEKKGRDETLLGLAVVSDATPMSIPGPVKMMGLFANDSQVPYKKGAPGTDAARLDAAYKHVDKVADLCIAASTFGVKMTAGGIGKLDGDLVVSAVEGTDSLTGLKSLGEDVWKELRSSFLIPTKRGTKVDLDIRSFTDPNYNPESEAWTYNQALSDRRCWGILGLLASRIAAKGKKPKAKAVWNAGVATDPDSEALKAYLKSPGALDPKTLG